MYQWREFAEAGGLMSYGNAYCRRIRIARTASTSEASLRGAETVRFASCPVSRPNLRLMINLKTAKALGLDDAWECFSCAADEVIE